MDRAPELEIDTAVRTDLDRHAREARPREAVGALFGHRLAPRWHAVEAVRLPNRAAAADRFDADPVAFAAAEAAARARGLDHLGFYHSHPAGPAEPSERDLAAAWPRRFLVIVGQRGDLGIRFANAPSVEAGPR